MSTIKKITVVLEVEGNDKPLIASLAFQGLQPNESDVNRLFHHLRLQSEDAAPSLRGHGTESDPQLKLNVTSDAKGKEADKA